MLIDRCPGNRRHDDRLGAAVRARRFSRCAPWLSLIDLHLVEDYSWRNLRLRAAINY